MSANNSPDPGTNAAAVAAAAAAAEAARQFTIQLWTLYSVGVLVTILRTYARIKAVSIGNLRGDDLLVWIAILFYTAQTVLGYSVGNVAHGLANNGMTDAERAALSPSDPEYHLRVIGSKIQLAGWSVYAALMCFLKLSVLLFYIRLTEGLNRWYRIKIWIGFGLVIGSSIASVAAVLLSCLPFNHNWQIYPDPGSISSLPIIWTSFAANVLTDIYLISIPLPMLWGSSLKLAKKIASSIVLGAGIFVLVCAMLKSIFVLVDPVNGAELAGEWGTREAFVAVFTTNLPMIFPLFKTWFRPIFGSVISSTHKSYVVHKAAQTIGGGSSRSKRNPRGSTSFNMYTTNLSTTASQEQMVNEIPLQSFKDSDEPRMAPHPLNAVYISNDIDVAHEDISGHRGNQSRQRGQEGW